jgi:hypothetical protein
MKTPALASTRTASVARLLKDTNLIAHDKLRQTPFFTGTLIVKYSDIFKQEWEDYLERPGSKNGLVGGICG